MPNPDPRPSWDEWGLRLAETVALRADCSRRQVGAVLMGGSHRIVAEGYNGAPAGQPGCLTAGACPRGRASTEAVEPGSSYDTGPGSCIALHAEQNVLLRASWEEQLGATLYVTDWPCEGCWRMILGTPVLAVVCRDRRWHRSAGEYGIRLDTGVIVTGPGWQSEAEVIDCYHGFNTNQVYGTLVRRASPHHDWEEVSRGNQ